MSNFFRHSEPDPGSNDGSKLHLILEGQQLVCVGGWFGSTNPQIVISFSDDKNKDTWHPIFTSESIANIGDGSQPRWKEIVLSMQQLCKGDPNQPIRIAVQSLEESTGATTGMGHLDTTVSQLLRVSGDATKAAALTDDNNTPYGNLIVRHARIQQPPRILNADLRKSIRSTMSWSLRKNTTARTIASTSAASVVSSTPSISSTVIPEELLKDENCKLRLTLEANLGSSSSPQNSAGGNLTTLVEGGWDNLTLSGVQSLWGESTAAQLDDEEQDWLQATTARLENFLSTTNPYFTLSPIDPNNPLASSGGLYKSEAIFDCETPIWKPANVALDLLCGGDLERPFRITLYSEGEGGEAPTLLGKLDTTILGLKRAALQDTLLVALKGPKKQGGTVRVLEATLPEDLEVALELELDTSDENSKDEEDNLKSTWGGATHMQESISEITGELGLLGDHSANLFSVRSSNSNSNLQKSENETVARELAVTRELVASLGATEGAEQTLVELTKEESTAQYEVKVAALNTSYTEAAPAPASSTAPRRPSDFGRIHDKIRSSISSHDSRRGSSSVASFREGESANDDEGQESLHDLLNKAMGMDISKNNQAMADASDNTNQTHRSSVLLDPLGFATEMVGAMTEFLQPSVAADDDDDKGGKVESPPNQIAEEKACDDMGSLLSAEKVPRDPNDTPSLFLTLKGSNLAAVGLPFFQISVNVGEAAWQSVYQSEQVPNSANPTWKEVALSLDVFRDEDLDRPIMFSIYATGEGDLPIGFFSASISDIALQSEGASSPKSFAVGTGTVSIRDVEIFPPLEPKHDNPEPHNRDYTLFRKPGDDPFSDLHIGTSDDCAMSCLTDMHDSHHKRDVGGRPTASVSKVPFSSSTVLVGDHLVLKELDHAAAKEESSSALPLHSIPPAGDGHGGPLHTLTELANPSKASLTGIARLEETSFGSKPSLEPDLLEEFMQTLHELESKDKAVHSLGAALEAENSSKKLSKSASHEPSQNPMVPDPQMAASLQGRIKEWEQPTKHEMQCSGVSKMLDLVEKDEKGNNVPPARDTNKVDLTNAFNNGLLEKISELNAQLKDRDKQLIAVQQNAEVYSNHCRELEAKLTNKIQALEKLETALGDANAKVAEGESRLAEAAATVQSMESDKRMDALKLETAAAEKEGLAEKLIKAKATADDLKAKLEESGALVERFEEDQNNHQKQVEAWKEEKIRANEKVFQLEVTIDASHGRIEDLKRELEHFGEEKAALESALEESQQESAATIASLRQQLVETNAILDEERISAARANAERLEAERTNVDVQEQDFEARLAEKSTLARRELESMLVDAENQIQTTQERARADAVAIATLSNQVNDLKGQVAALTEQSNETTRRTAEDTETLRRHTEEKANLQKSLHEAQELAQAHKQDLADAEKKALLLTESVKARDRMVGKAQDEVIAMKQEKEDYLLEKAEWEHKLQEANTRMSSNINEALKTTLKQASSKVKMYEEKSAVDDSKITELGSQNTMLKERMMQLEKISEEKSETLLRFGTALQAKDSLIQELQMETSNLRGKLEHTTGHRESVVESELEGYEKAKAKAASLEEVVNILQQKIPKLEEKNTALLLEKAQEYERASSLQTSLDEKEAELRRKREIIDSLKKRRSASILNVATEKDKLAREEKEKKRAEKKVKQLEKKVADLEKDLDGAHFAKGVYEQYWKDATVRIEQLKGGSEEGPPLSRKSITSKSSSTKKSIRKSIKTAKSVSSDDDTKIGRAEASSRQSISTSASRRKSTRKSLKSTKSDDAQEIAGGDEAIVSGKSKLAAARKGLRSSSKSSAEGQSAKKTDGAKKKHKPRPSIVAQIMAADLEKSKESEKEKRKSIRMRKSEDSGTTSDDRDKRRSVRKEKSEDSGTTSDDNATRRRSRRAVKAIDEGTEGSRTTRRESKSSLQRSLAASKTDAVSLAKTTPTRRRKSKSKLAEDLSKKD